ncbi:sulfatase, partial [Bacteroidota bacterium]
QLWSLVYVFTPLLFVFISCSTKNTDYSTDTHPNILLVFTDQQNVNMMSVMENPNLVTPNMDKLAHQGIMFMESYCTSPVCGPARSSIISGRMPHETGVEWNGDIMKEDVENAGEIFRKAGYNTIWAGKWHLPESYPQRAKAKEKEIKGFNLLSFWDPNKDRWMLGAETDPPLTEAVVEFLNNYDSDKPFFMGVSYHNPHDICFYPRKDGWFTENDSLLEIRHYGFKHKLPDPIGIHPDQVDVLPPLPFNHETHNEEPDFIKDKRMDHDEYGMETKLANLEFNENEWRGYYNAYCRLTEMVDIEIGKVMDALDRNGLKENTLVVFTSDHGDGAGSHKWAAKLSLYEESSKVPLILKWPAHIPSMQVDKNHLVSQIDILPTILDYADVKTDVEFTGSSLRCIIENQNAKWREYLIVELADYKPDSSRKGRMIRSEKYKYNVYSLGKNNEQLFDLTNDPGEMNNLIDDPDYKLVIENHKKMLKEWIDMTDDDFILSKTN